MVHTGRDSKTPLKPLLRYETLLFGFPLACGTCKGFYPEYSKYFPSDECLSKEVVDQKLREWPTQWKFSVKQRNAAFPLCKLFEELCKVLGDESVPELPAEEPPNKRRKLNPKSPLVILAFDEIHTLAKPEDNNSWSSFGEIRRAIRGLTAS